jgi:large subunit ribosomal protein L23
MALFSKKTVAETKATTKDETKSVSMQDLYADKPAKGAKAKATKAKIKPGSQAYRTLVKPLITEKASALNALHKYLFAVAPTANKISVASAIVELYGVKPVKVNIIKMEGKVKMRGRIQGQRKD